MPRLGLCRFALAQDSLPQADAIRAKNVRIALQWAVSAVNISASCGRFPLLISVLDHLHRLGKRPFDGDLVGRDRKAIGLSHANIDQLHQRIATVAPSSCRLSVFASFPGERAVLRSGR
jgi:hypothetical protein